MAAREAFERARELAPHDAQAQVALADLFNVFPNPTTDVLRWNGVAVDRIRVIDTQGRVRLETTNAVGSLDLSSLENGVFMVVIEADGQRAVKSVLKH